MAPKTRPVAAGKSCSAVADDCLLAVIPVIPVFPGREDRSGVASHRDRLSKSALASVL